MSRGFSCFDGLGGEMHGKYRVSRVLHRAIAPSEEEREAGILYKRKSKKQKEKKRKSGF